MIKQKKQYILFFDGLYISEDLLEDDDFLFIGTLRQNGIKSNKDIQ